jgi:hypothetical protein
MLGFFVDGFDNIRELNLMNQQKPKKSFFFLKKIPKRVLG